MKSGDRRCFFHSMKAKNGGLALAACPRFSHYILGKHRAVGGVEKAVKTRKAGTENDGTYELIDRKQAKE